MNVSRRTAGGAGEVRKAATILRRVTDLRPAVALVLGSGFQESLGGLEIEVELPFQRLPGFPRARVAGHAGRVIIGRFGPTPVVVLKGRAHFYEGYEMEAVTHPVRVLSEFGIKELILTNAAGGINPRFRPGDFMVLTDHINFMGVNPLRGPDRPGRARFVDLSQVYDLEGTKKLARAGRKAGLRVHRGVYVAVSGPSYETPAEIRAFRRLGADAVGMSTVPEAVVARQEGMRVAALSCITNVAAGLGGATGVSHAEVLAEGRRKTAAMARMWAGLFA